MSAAIFDLESRLVFAHAGGERFELASVAKIYILAAYLDKLAQEGRGPGPDEFELMRAMIEYSDNRSATELFQAIGGADGINAFLIAHHLAPIEPAPDESWGSIRASSIQVGQFLAGLYTGEVLDVSQTSFSFNLLANVIDEQDWGVGAAEDGAGISEVYLKNGWFPSDEGWIVNSVGLLQSTDRTYVVVLMSDRQPDFEAAVQGIEKTVALIRARLFDPALGPMGTPKARNADRTPTVTPEPVLAPTQPPPMSPAPSPDGSQTPEPRTTPNIPGGPMPSDSFVP